MTHTAREPGKRRRGLAAFWAFLEALESGASGYDFDRIENLEREVERLREELRQTRDPRPVAAHDTTDTPLER